MKRGTLGTAYDELVAAGLVRPREEHGLTRQVMQRIAAKAQRRAQAVLVNRHKAEYDELYQSEKAALIAEAQSA